MHLVARGRSSCGGKLVPNSLFSIVTIKPSQRPPLHTQPSDPSSFTWIPKSAGEMLCPFCSRLSWLTVSTQNSKSSNSSGQTSWFLTHGMPGMPFITRVSPPLKGGRGHSTILASQRLEPPKASLQTLGPKSRLFGLFLSEGEKVLHQAPSKEGARGRQIT